MEHLRTHDFRLARLPYGQHPAPRRRFFTCIFVGWRLDRKILKAEISNNGTLKFRIYGVFIFLVRYVCPAVLLLIFLDNLGLF